MPASGAFIPGTAVPGLAVPGYLAPAAAGSGGIVVGTAPVLIGAAPAGTSPRLAGWLRVMTASAGAPIFVGGAHVTAGNGAQVQPGARWHAALFAGDALYACTAAGTAAITVLQTGA